MSRNICRRWELRGTLVAESPIHVGGLGISLLHDALVRDGLDRPMLPGTSLAGVIRAALSRDSSESERRLWGVEAGVDEHGRDDGTGHASWVRINDAVASPGKEPAYQGKAPLRQQVKGIATEVGPEVVPEIQEHVSIDRIHGTAARGHLFIREVLPIGTRFDFRMVVDDAGEAMAENGTGETAAEKLVSRVATLLCGPGIRVGAATTKGLGRIRLHDGVLRCFNLSTRAGVVATLRDIPEKKCKLQDQDPSALAPGMLRVVIPWRPRSPLAVHINVDGDVVDAFPLTTVVDDTVRLILPGDSIKGVLRAHAERIMRTVTGQSAPVAFLDQMKAEGLGPVASLFGTAAGGDENGGPTGRRGALRVQTCVSEVGLPRDEWAAVRLHNLRRANDHDAKDEHHAALAELQQAVTTLNKKIKGIWFAVAQHVAVDRWTGGAAKGLLFATIEPHITSPDVWQPIIVDIDVSRLGVGCARGNDGQSGPSEDGSRAAIALLILLLRDLCDGWVSFGHGTTRGMGAVHVDADDVRFRAGPEVGWLAELDRRSLKDIFDNFDLIHRLTEAWPPVLTNAVGISNEGEG